MLLRVFGTRSPYATRGKAGVGFPTRDNDYITRQKHDSAVEFAKSSDVLIAEASLFSKDAKKENTNDHLTAIQAATIAKDANVGLLLLSHIWSEYNEDDILTEAKSIFKETYIPHDGLTYVL